MEGCGWLRTLKKDLVKCYCFKFFFCFFQSKMRYSVTHCPVNRPVAVHHIAHISKQPCCLFIILLCLEVTVYCIHSVILFLFSDYRHTPYCAVGIWCQSNFVQVRIKYVVTYVNMCVCVHTHTHTLAHLMKMCIYLNNKHNKTFMYLWPCKIWYTFHKFYCFNIFL